MVVTTTMIGQIKKSKTANDPAPRGVSGNATTTQKNTEAQSINVKAAIESLVVTGDLNQQDAPYVITSQHISRTSKTHHIYYNQAVNGLMVYGTESSLHISENGEVVGKHNNFVKNISAQVQTRAAGVTAAQAIEHVAQQMGYSISNLNELERSNQIDQRSLYTGAGISGTEIPVKLMYYYRPGFGVNLVWELSVQELSTSNYWNFRVNASNGAIIDKDNWTVSCVDLGDHNAHTHQKEDLSIQKTTTTETYNYNVPMVGSYNVYALPSESPNHSGRTLVSDPDNATASPFGWHDTNGVAGAESNYTIGNNCDAYDDSTSTQTGTGSGTNDERADGGVGLNFDFTIDLNVNNNGRSIDAAVTNLFYWTNITHDLFYIYGFDEASGNFQENNYGNGGVGGDHVFAEAQDGSGTCNANFSTPADGGNGRMQMYVCGTRDGDLDNGVVVHEYGHGISTRLTGGAANSGCLNNTEQMGEGWSDYFGLLMTIEPGDAGTDARGIGTWLLGQSANGAGIRDQRYDTDDNTYNYDTIKTAAVPHGVGSVWAMMCWEMTWDLIADHGVDADVYNFTGDVAQDKGNVMALALVVEALKLQPCSPGFVDGRDAILAADQTLYGGANQCTIWRAFARRGLGYSASQGSSGDRSDGTMGFDVPPITLAVSNNSFCSAEAASVITGGVISGGSYAGPGVTDDGNGLSFTFDPVAAGVGTHTITYTATDCDGNVNSDTDTITVTNDPPTMSCDASVTIALDPTTGLATFDPTTPSSAVLVGGNNGSNSEGFSALVVNVTEDVTVSFDWSYSTTDGPQYDSFGYILDDTYFALSATTGNPQNDTFSIALTTGQQFGFCTYTVDNGFGAATGTVTNFSPGYSDQFQAANWVEVQQNSDGSADFLGAISTVNSFCGTATVTPDQTTFTCLDIGTTNVGVTLTDSSGQSTSCSVAVTITGGATATTFSAGAWSNGDPTGISAVTISDNYNTASLGSFDACSCQVDAMRTLTVGAGDYVKVSGDIIVNGDLIVEHQGNLVQVDKDAVVTKNGTINVNVTTPTLQTRDFMVMGSPMTAEMRTNVFANAFLVLKFNPTNFIPNTGVPTGGTNFADDNGDFYSTYNGMINPGEGYVVRPQSGYTDPANTTYDMIYELGTLNNGDISYTYNNNGSLVNPSGTPNVLANPYASAISANAFMAENGATVLYFWEHITPPSPSLPGAGSMNFSMDDISYYNGSMGVPAANDTGTTTAPNGVISTGQGFALRTTGAAGTTGTMNFTNDMRLTTGNTTLRAPIQTEPEIERLTLNVRNDEYGVGSYAGIAFHPEADAGLDENLDTKRLATVVSLYSHLEDGTEQLGIQTLSEFEQGVKIPMGFATQVDAHLEYRIAKSDIEGINLSEATVYLIDNYTGEITNLNDGDYTFGSGKGVFDHRFTIQFEGEVLGTSDINLEAISVYPNPTNNILNIVSPQLTMVEVTMHDMQGRRVNRINVNSTVTQLDLSNLNAAIYFLTISTENGSITKRVTKN